LIYEFGDTSDVFNIASIRKSLVAVLFGIYQYEANIDFNKTLLELGINDSTPELTATEKQATIEDLLKMRSGIYHNANFETQSAKELKPQRGTFKHDTNYYYNNWDSNTLGTIFKQLTGVSVFDGFNERVAKVLGMQDFNVSDCEFVTPDCESIHLAYKFRMSVRDLTLFCQLLLNKGVWNNKVIFSTDWFSKMLSIYSNDEEGKGVGYLWNIENNGRLWGNITYPSGAFGFSGYPGHFILIIPEKDMTIVYEHSIGDKIKPYVSSEEFGEIVKLIFS
jgi:CubicO group peptidase (beta-lactamase class C family)